MKKTLKIPKNLKKLTKKKNQQNQRQSLNQQKRKENIKEKTATTHRTAFTISEVNVDTVINVVSNTNSFLKQST